MNCSYISCEDYEMWWQHDLCVIICTTVLLYHFAQSSHLILFSIEYCHVVTQGCPFAWSHPFDRLGKDQDHAESGNLQFDRGSSSAGLIDEEIDERIGVKANAGRHISDAETFTDSLGNTGTWPVNADSLTAHLCLWCDVPVVPALPEPLEGPCILADTAKDLLGCNSNFIHDGFYFQR